MRNKSSMHSYGATQQHDQLPRNCWRIRGCKAQHLWSRFEFLRPDLQTVTLDRQISQQGTPVLVARCHYVDMRTVLAAMLGLAESVSSTVSPRFKYLPAVALDIFSCLLTHLMKSNHTSTYFPHPCMCHVSVGRRCWIGHL